MKKTLKWQLAAAVVAAINMGSANAQPSSASDGVSGNQIVPSGESKINPKKEKGYCEGVVQTPIGQMMITVKMKAKEGLEEQLKQDLMSLVIPTRSEPGCLSYLVHQSTLDKSVFMVYEEWASRKDLITHVKLPYIQAFKKKCDELLREPFEVKVWDVLSP